MSTTAGPLSWPFSPRSLGKAFTNVSYAADLSTFDEALANETKPYSQSELLGQFRKWLAGSK